MSGNIACFDNGTLIAFADAFPPDGSDAAPMTRIDITGIDPAPQIGWVLVNGVPFPPSSPPAAAAPVYPDLSPNGLIALAMAVGGLTQTKLVAISVDTATGVKAFWLMFSVAGTVSRPGTDTPSQQTTASGLAALVAGGYLTSADVDAITAAWPTAA